jgi:hypothetical protein
MAKEGLDTESCLPELPIMTTNTNVVEPPTKRLLSVLQSGSTVLEGTLPQ